MNNQVFATNGRHSLLLKRTGELVPENEPVYVLRARDKGALATIRVNQSQFAPTSEHWKVVQNVIEDFAEFRQKNPDLMGEPSEVY